MKATLVSTAIFALCLSAPVLARKKKGNAGSSSSTAGNTIDTSYKFDKDTFGAGSTLNLGVQAQNNGGNARSKRAVQAELELYIREVEDEIELLSRRGLFSGGNARGGDTSSKGGNKVSNVNNLSKVSMGSQNVLDMNTQTQIKGGNSQSGAGGVFEALKNNTDSKTQINFGNGGKGGGLSFGKRAYSSGGMNGGVYTMSSKVTANGNNAYSHHGHSNSKDGAPGMTMHFPRGGFMSGGDAKGGGSSSKGGNTANSKNDFRGLKMGNGNAIMASTQNILRGGNSRSGNGGANSGSGGAGGQLSMQLPPLPPIKRDIIDLEYNDIFSREVLDDLYHELFVREADPEAEADPEFEDEGEYLY